MRRGSALVIALFLGIFGWSSASAEIELAVGAKGGATIADLMGDDAGETEALLGFVFGGFLTANVAENFAIQVEGLFTRKGTEDSLGAKLKLDYIEFPVLAVAVVPVGAFSRVRGYAGPNLAFNVNADAAGTDVSDTVKGFEFGGVIGGGADFDVGQVFVVFDVRWTFGFSSIDDTEFDADVKNSVVSFTGGFSFPLGGR